MFIWTILDVVTLVLAISKQISILTSKFNYWRLKISREVDKFSGDKFKVEFYFLFLIKI